jgi:hypothetical protein
MWQYNVGAEGYVNGISTRIDLNYWYGPFPTADIPIINDTWHGWYLYPATESKHTATYGARPNTQTFPSQTWITGPVKNGNSAIYTMPVNSSENARDGSIRLEDGNIVTEVHHILQCGQKTTYDNDNDPIPLTGGSATITLPNGYQYSQYGDLLFKNTDDWATVTSTQSKGDARATVTVTAQATTVARSCTIQVWMKGRDNPSVECHIADISVRQNGIVQKVVRGDINGDGKINTIDAIMLAQHIVGVNLLTGDALLAADINGDGKINTIDAIVLAQYIVGGFGIELN